jgi:hypothetical protein
MRERTRNLRAWNVQFGGNVENWRMIRREVEKTRARSVSWRGLGEGVNYD